MLDDFDSLDVIDMSELDFERRMPGWAGGVVVDGEATACDESAILVSNIRMGYYCNGMFNERQKLSETSSASRNNPLCGSTDRWSVVGLDARTTVTSATRVMIP